MTIFSVYIHTVIVVSIPSYPSLLFLMTQITHASTDFGWQNILFDFTITFSHHFADKITIFSDFCIVKSLIFQI
jgi:hypothetical protein